MSAPSSGASTPNPRFTPQAKTAEDILSHQTVGLVNLSDFRKRRAEAVELKERHAHESLLGTTSSTTTTTTTSRVPSAAATPAASGAATPPPAEPPKKKTKRKAGPAKLSFGVDDDEEAAAAPSSNPPPKDPTSAPAPPRRKFAANASVGAAPRAVTKRSLAHDSAAREALRKEYVGLQERVKGSLVALPFVFYDGSNVPGGVCLVAKGDYVWKFLDASRKVGAQVGAGVGGEAAGGGGDAKARREWAKVGVDDLMMVRGEIIIPPHYDFYYFIMNKTLGPNQRLLFDYSAEPAPDSAAAPPPSDVIPDNYNPLSRPSAKPRAAPALSLADLEGANDDPAFTKVVDRRWYERNKHIYPASVWQEFDPEKDYQKEVKRDVGGNAFFFS